MYTHLSIKIYKETDLDSPQNPLPKSSKKSSWLNDNRYFLLFTGSDQNFPKQTKQRVQSKANLQTDLQNDSFEKVSIFSMKIL